jgi:hypothetical protein
MDKPRFAIVVTTINNGDFLERYCQHLDVKGWRDNLTIIVIPDRKSPSELYQKCKSLVSRGFNILCPSLFEQETYLSRFDNLAHIIPYDSDNRRNIGFLMALEQGNDILISIDDDNMCRAEEDFIGEHAVVCQNEKEFETVHSANGWFNICDLMDVQPQNVYPRGFPYRFRRQPAEIRYCVEQGTVHLNAGLWLKEPDLDAVTWLANPARSVSFRGQSVLLGRDTWSPINSQNTAIYRDAIVSYYFVRMGYQLGGMNIDRYGDIFSGYFCQACVCHLGYRIRIGTPVVDHIRNTHNYLHDLTNELACILLIEDIAPWLKEVKLEGSTYVEAYLSLAAAIEDAVEKFSGFLWNESTRDYFHQMAHHMRIWTKAVCTITN